MSRQYKKLITISVFVIIGGILLIASPDQKTPIHTPADQAQQPAASKPSHPNIPAQTTNSTSAADTNQSKEKLTSPTIQSNPDRPQIPYYLLASVNDPLFGSGWYHSKIQTTRAWDLTTGSTSKTVAVIDTGFELNHEDLTGKWYQNNAEIGLTQNGGVCWTGSATNKSTNNCDDDQNGYVDDWRGYDFFYGDNSPQAGQVNPSGEGTQHATLVSGVVAATTNNTKGSAGVDQNTRILPLQVFSDDGEAYTDDLVAAIDYATDMNADVINLSLGTNQYDNTLLSAINRARTNGTLVIAASGNCALNDEEFCNNLTAPGRMTYPALYQSVIAVGATTSSDQRASYSSYGPELDITAPGSSIGPLPIYNGSTINSYATASGTSFAAPLTAGLASLLMAQNPNATISQIENLLTESADKVSAMNNQIFTNEFGNGRINAHKATLLGLAKTQENLLGSPLTSPRQAAVGRLWRTSSGVVSNDEFVLVGCRVFETDICSATAENNTVYRFTPANKQKGDAIQYIFINGSGLPNGTSKISVHNHEYASFITTITK